MTLTVIRALGLIISIQSFWRPQCWTSLYRKATHGLYTYYVVELQLFIITCLLTYIFVSLLLLSAQSPMAVLILSYGWPVLVSWCDNRSDIC